MTAKMGLVLDRAIPEALAEFSAVRLLGERQQPRQSVLNTCFPLTVPTKVPLT